MRRSDKTRKTRGLASVRKRSDAGRERAQGSSRGKWAWHRNALLHLRDYFLAGRSERLTQAATPLEPHSMDLADSATDEFDRDIVLSELSAEQDALYEIEEALRRIQNNVYGICELTGRPISKERLRAVPWTRFSQEAAELVENEGRVRHPRLGELNSVRRSGAEALERKVEELETQKHKDE